MIQLIYLGLMVEFFLQHQIVKSPPFISRLTIVATSQEISSLIAQYGEELIKLIMVPQILSKSVLESTPDKSKIGILIAISEVWIKYKVLI